VGNDTDPNNLYSTYGSQRPWGSMPVLSESSVLKNPQLKPEAISTYEIGINIALFQQRVDLDVTYYDIRTKDQILPLTLTETSGYASRVINAGEIRNAGI